MGQSLQETGETKETKNTFKINLRTFPDIKFSRTFTLPQIGISKHKRKQGSLQKYWRKIMKSKTRSSKTKKVWSWRNGSKPS